ncbi:hypothetical protein CR103_05365 [Massilia psychrophila]|uniref:Uncharacterized protein n=1 Tax=Massilia psychrophila TaxID=1603353 RepID=A0A2G8T495_9BURK|nr:hypothetical protein CR103_05365 [Massilia psychrophila]
MRSDPIGLNFAALKAEGIDALRGLCGELWTDYNLHDPGVTVLEQLVYGLTDLAYRTEFDVADYLTGPDGAIAYDALALYAPQDVFHGQALTVGDYRRSLYDAIPSINEIWVRACGNGLLAIDVAVPTEIQTPQGRASIAQQVRIHYASNRNLCEDLRQVTVLESVAYYLDGDIELYGERAPAEILAQILFDCCEYISSGMAALRLRDVVAQGMPPETVYEGPPTSNGFISIGEEPTQARSVTVSELVGVIRRIDGVRRVRSLVFLDADGVRSEEISCDTRNGYYPCLQLPKDAARAFLRLHAEDSAGFGMDGLAREPASALLKNQAFHEDAEHALRKLRFDRNAFRTITADGAVFPLPVGRYRELAQYYSVQNDFPAVYGIGQYGLPQSAGPARIAQAQQLKGFLFPFEQMMANYLQNLQEIPTLFSADSGGDASYFHKQLSNREIPDIEALLIDPEGADFRALKEQDDYCERKGRVLDYLLALHGDAFPQTTLRRFNQYHANDTERWLLGAKAQLVRSLVVLSAWRGTACNYLAEPGSESGVSVLERRVAILIGLDGGTSRGDDGAAWSGAPHETAGAQMRARAPGWQGVAPGLDSGLDLDAPPAPAADAFTPTMFRAGVALANYALDSDEHGTGTDLYCGIGDTWSRVGHYPTRRAAVQAAHACVDTLVAANQACECLRIVEHILLWPSDRVPLEKDFYGARMSVVLPDWTARCVDGDFRQFVQETVRRNCPAHVHPTFLWLAPAPMAAFDALWRNWRGALRTLHRDRAAPAAHAASDRAAGALAALLMTPEGSR